MKRTTGATNKGRPRSNLLERNIFAFFVLIAFVAVAGFMVIPFQEKNRIRLSAEYEAYQFATGLLQEVQTKANLDYEQIEGLTGFGIYSVNGDAIFRTTLAPLHVKDTDVSEGIRFRNERIRLLLRVGGKTAPWNGHMRRSAEPYNGIAGNPYSGRYLFIEYAAPALAKGLSFVSAVGVLASLALILAFALIFIMFRRLESYRAEESKNRELIKLGGAARTLAHEIKNPLATILLRCSLARKKIGEKNMPELAGIEEETNRIANLVGRIREILISGEDGNEQTGNLGQVRAIVPPENVKENQESPKIAGGA